MLPQIIASHQNYAVLWTHPGIEMIQIMPHTMYIVLDAMCSNKLEGNYTSFSEAQPALGHLKKQNLVTGLSGIKTSKSQYYQPYQLCRGHLSYGSPLQAFEQTDLNREPFHIQKEFLANWFFCPSMLLLRWKVPSMTDIQTGGIPGEQETCNHPSLIPLN